jgi:hypothetical protein
MDTLERARAALLNDKSLFVWANGTPIGSNLLNVNIDYFPPKP